MAVKCSKWPKTCQHSPFQSPSKFTQIGIFGLKINHLATLFHIAKGESLEPILRRQQALHVLPFETIYGVINKS
jgi:hypothetical protein